MLDDFAFHGTYHDCHQIILIAKYWCYRKYPTYHPLACLHDLWVLGCHFDRSLQVHRDEQAYPCDLDFRHTRFGNRRPVAAVFELVLTSPQILPWVLDSFLQCSSCLTYLLVFSLSLLSTHGTFHYTLIYMWKGTLTWDCSSRIKELPELGQYCHFQFLLFDKGFLSFIHFRFNPAFELSWNQCVNNALRLGFKLWLTNIANIFSWWKRILFEVRKVSVDGAFSPCKLKNFCYREVFSMWNWYHLQIVAF